AEALLRFILRSGTGGDAHIPARTLKRHSTGKKAPSRGARTSGGGNPMHKGLLVASAAGFVVLVGTGSVNAADKLKVGVTATLEGTYTVLGEDGMRGYELAVEAHGGRVAGKEIESIVGATDASPDSAIRAAKKLVEQDKVDMLISPLSGSEGIAIRDYSKTQPQITVMNAGSGALET